MSIISDSPLTDTFQEVASPPARRFTHREGRFIDEFLACGNGTLAAERAGYSKRTASAIAAEVRRKPHIRAEIERRLSLLEAEAAERIRQATMLPTRRSERGYVYVVRADNGLVKIGMALNWHLRIQQLNSALPYELEVLHVVECDEPRRLERTLHERYAEKRVRREWFRLSDADLECFTMPTFADQGSLFDDSQETIVCRGVLGTSQYERHQSGRVGGLFRCQE